MTALLPLPDWFAPVAGGMLGAGLGWLAWWLGPAREIAALHRELEMLRARLDRLQAVVTRGWGDSGLKTGIQLEKPAPF